MSKKVLLHICCGGCGIYPIGSLREEGFEVFGFFYNPNIQPYQEYLQRRDAVREMGERLGVRILFKDDYNLTEWLRMVAFREARRCELCYYERLKETARYARRGRFDYFSSSLFYSKQQKHELAINLAESVAREQRVNFLYRDFRSGWKKGVERSLEMGIYRQQYCGCVYSEYERFKGAGRKNKEVAE